MKKERIFLVLSIVSILLLFILIELQKPTISGEIERITGTYPLRIFLRDHKTEIIVFEKRIALEESNQIEVYGTKQNEKEIIANRIICLNC